MAERVNCGKEGRIARGVLRGVGKYYMSKEEALRHVENCERCQERISDSLENNPSTTYEGDTPEEVVENARQSGLPAFMRSLRVNR